MVFWMPILVCGGREPGMGRGGIRCRFVFGGELDSTGCWKAGWRVVVGQQAT